MGVSFQEPDLVSEPERGPRARTRKLMLETAVALMQAGQTPSVSDVAEAAEVSRATAYRYFPSQAALVHAVVDAGLGPILKWDSASGDAEARVRELLALSMPRIAEFQATFRASLKLALDQWARRRAGTLGNEPAFTRGHRMEVLQRTIAPLRKELGEKRYRRLAQSLSLTNGLETLLVLHDMWGLELDEAQEVAQWSAAALIRAAIAEADAQKPARRTTPRLKKSQ